ncbi:MAG: GFA family protein [Cyanobacteria bacterium P01_D01_bin.50]
MRTNIDKLVSYEGGCHCGEVRFRVLVGDRKLLKCNCSICTKKGFLHLIVPQDNFNLLKGEDNLTTYTFNTGVAKHKFCRHCGIHSFYTPRSHPDCVSVNVHCLDDDVISQFEIVPFDGRNWEDNIQQLRQNRE